MADDTLLDLTVDFHDLKALLRFRDAMTPEMWEVVKNEADVVRISPLPGSESEDAVIAALDTLRQALQQERQG